MSIIFEKDWYGPDGRPRAYVHAETKNRTFYRTAKVLQQMGIKNWKFMLCLYDPSLRNVDPHAVNDTNDPTGRIRKRIALECYRNIWYYIRECVRIPVEGGSPIPYELHRGNLAMTWCFVNSIDFSATQPRQTGKGQPLDAKIKIPGGWTTMGKLKVGDVISAPDGTTTKVIGVYPQGKKKVYRLTFADGRSTRCDDSHLWKVHNPFWKPDTTKWRVVDTKFIFERFKRCPNTEARLSVPVVSTDTTTPEADLPIDPYVMGVLLGDGGMTGETVSFTTKDKFILEELKSRLPSHFDFPYRGRYDYDVIDRSRIGGGTSPFITKLRYLGVWGKLSYQKTIPDTYMNASYSQRLDLVRGLMDTDGTVGRSSDIQFCTSSLIMGYQFQSLIRGLGGICKRRVIHPSYTLNGEKQYGREAYVFSVRFPTPKDLFLLPRKKDIITDAYKSAHSFKLNITNIEYLGEEETQCIMVDHPEHLYITDDYIVTHNTIGACVCNSWIEYITGYRFTIAMLTHNAKLVRDNVKRMKAIRDCLPTYIIRRSKADVDNKEGLSYAALGNSYVTYIGSKDRAAADNVGRGATAPIIHVDEIGFIANIDISFEVIMSSTNAARQNAIRNGQLHGNLYTTTAADPMTKSGLYAFEFIQKAMPFTERLYDCKDIVAARQMVKSNSKNNVVNGTFSYLQLGKTHEWFEETITRNNVSPEGVKRDYLNQWISAAKNPILSKESLKILNDSKMEPVFTELFNEFVVNWYVPKDMALSNSYRNKRLVMGMDSSEAIGNDFTAFVCIDPKDLSVVFTFRCNDVNTTKIGLLAARLLFDFPNMIFVPERKNTGVGITDAVTDALMNRGINPFKRIYNSLVQNQGTKEYERIDPNDASLATMGQYRKRIGFVTTGPTRNILYKSVLQQAANLAGDKARDHNLVNELGALQVINGRIDHTTGSHDDSVIAWALACFLILQGRNLQFYGLGPEDLLSPEDIASKKNDVVYLRSQIGIRRKIRDLEDKVAVASSESLQRVYLSEIKRLRAYVDDAVSIEPISRDVVGNDFREYNELISSSQSRDRPTEVKRFDPMKLMSIF